MLCFSDEHCECTKKNPKKKAELELFVLKSVKKTLIFTDKRSIQT